jgi:hypothetical protein
VLWEKEARFANLFGDIEGSETHTYCTIFLLFTLYPIANTVKKVSDFPIHGMSGCRDVEMPGNAGNNNYSPPGRV